MSYLLVTDIIAEVKRPEPDASVLAWLAEQPLSAMYLSVITLGELQERIAALADANEARALQGWLDGVREGFAGRILDVTPAVALTWGRLRADARKRGQAAAAVDLLVATAVTHRLVLVTRSPADVGTRGVEVLTP